MNLTNSDITQLIEWRHELHRWPDLSGEEMQTAARVVRQLEKASPDRIMTGLGGHGVAAIYEGATPGPTVLLRCELDGLPIQEIGDRDYRSEHDGRGHLCGHDGHMATLAAVARILGRQRPSKGRVVLLFQPAEETGAGAAAVISDSRFDEIRPDYAFALHNYPGIPHGHVLLGSGPVNCASRGMKIVLSGKTAHASQPETGISPMRAVADLMPALEALGNGGGRDETFTMVTLTHARLGEPAFGVAPGNAEVWATLRTLTDSRMSDLVKRTEDLVRATANAHQLSFTVAYDDIFRHCENHPEAVQLLGEALEAEGLTHDDSLLPMRGSEDFGRFADHAKSAMFLLGAGEHLPALHNPDYDFPDSLIEIGSRVFIRVIRQMLS